MPCNKKNTTCEFSAYGMETMPKCCKNHLIETIFYTTWLLSLYEIKHWIDYGTLLGAVREGGFIPWDSDGDFGIMEESKSQILQLRQKIKQDGFHLHISSKNVLQIVYSKHNWSYVELWSNSLTTANNHKPNKFSDKLPADYSPINKKPIKEKTLICESGGPGTRWDHTSDFPYWFVEDTHKVKFEGKYLPSPKVPEHFLDMRFGNWQDPVRKYEAYFGGNARSLHESLKYVKNQKYIN